MLALLTRSLGPRAFLAGALGGVATWWHLTKDPLKPPNAGGGGAGRAGAGPAGVAGMRHLRNEVPPGAPDAVVRILRVRCRVARCVRCSVAMPWPAPRAPPR